MRWIFICLFLDCAIPLQLNISKKLEMCKVKDIQVTDFDSSNWNAINISNCSAA